MSINKESMTGIALMRFYDYFKFDTFFLTHTLYYWNTSQLNKAIYRYTSVYSVHGPSVLSGLRDFWSPYLEKKIGTARDRTRDLLRPKRVLYH